MEILGARTHACTQPWPDIYPPSGSANSSHAFVPSHNFAENWCKLKKTTPKIVENMRNFGLGNLILPPKYENTQSNTPIFSNAAETVRVHIWEELSFMGVLVTNNGAQQVSPLRHLLLPIVLCRMLGNRIRDDAALHSSAQVAGNHLPRGLPRR